MDFFTQPKEKFIECIGLYVIQPRPLDDKAHRQGGGLLFCQIRLKITSLF